jgi:hypothetical protein
LCADVRQSYHFEMYEYLLPLHGKLLYEYMKHAFLVTNVDLFAAEDTIHFISRLIVFFLLDSLDLHSKWKCEAVLVC